MSRPFPEFDAEIHVGSEKMEPIPVYQVPDPNAPAAPPERIAAADFGAFGKVVLAGTETKGAKLSLLPRENKRNRAVIWITPGAAGNVAGKVIIGSAAQCDGGTGAELVNGMSLTYEGASPVFLAADGTNSLTVNFVDERFR